MERTHISVVSMRANLWKASRETTLATTGPMPCVNTLMLTVDQKICPSHGSALMLRSVENACFEVWQCMSEFLTLGLSFYTPTNKV